MKRPLRITLLLGLVLITTALSLVRFLTALAWRSTLDEYLPPWQVLYIATTGLVWAAAGLFLLWSYHRGGRHTDVYFLAAAGVYGAWAWADRLVVQTTPRANWMFSLLMTVVLLGFVAFVVLDPRNQPYFRKETYERKAEDQ